MAAALAYYWVLAGFPEGAAWLEWSLGAIQDPSPARVRGLACHAFFVLERGEDVRASNLLDEARVLAEAIDDRAGIGMAFQFLGVLHCGSGDFDQADTLLGEPRRRFESDNCTAGLWGCRYDLGWLALASSHPDRAADEFERALHIGRSAGSEDLIAHSLAALAPLVALSGDAGRAQSLAAEAIAITRGLGLQLFVVMALVRAAEVAILNRTDAATLVVEALTILRDVGGTAWLADALELTAVVQTGRNAPQQAARLLGVADRLTGVSGGRPSIRAIRSEIDHCRVEVEQALGAALFRRELASGLAMPAT